MRAGRLTQHHGAGTNVRQGRCLDTEFLKIHSLLSTPCLQDPESDAFLTVAPRCSLASRLPLAVAGN